MQRKIERFLRRLESQIDDLESLLSEAAAVAPQVSKWSIGEHVEHCAIALAGTGERFETALRTGPVAVPGGPSLVGKIILWSGFIPRGKGKAPQAVLPQKIDRHRIREALAKERQRWSDLKPDIGVLQASGWRFSHPIFGPLTPLQWLRFNEIHLHHHRKVIEDIRKAA